MTLGALARKLAGFTSCHRGLHRNRLSVLPLPPPGKHNHILPYEAKVRNTFKSTTLNNKLIINVSYQPRTILTHRMRGSVRRSITIGILQFNYAY